MPDRLPSGLLRPAPRPPSWVDRWGWWAVPAALAFGIVGAAVWAHMPWTAGWFMFIGVALCWMGQRVEVTR